MSEYRFPEKLYNDPRDYSETEPRFWILTLTCAKCPTWEVRCLQLASSLADNLLCGGWECDACSWEKNLKAAHTARLIRINAQKTPEQRSAMGKKGAKAANIKRARLRAREERDRIRRVRAAQLAKKKERREENAARTIAKRTPK